MYQLLQIALGFLGCIGIRVQSSPKSLDVATISELVYGSVRRRGNSGNDGDGQEGWGLEASFEVGVLTINVEKRYTSLFLSCTVILW